MAVAMRCAHHFDWERCPSLQGQVSPMSEGLLS